MNWKHWPYSIFYLPICYAWIGFYIKSRSFWFFTSSNPTITFGGFEGEGKCEMYRQLPKEYCPKSILIHPSQSFTEVRNEVHRGCIKYPFIVKPDVGMKGILFRKIMNEQQLQTYHRQMPAAYIIQDFIDMPYEISLFYYRKPTEEKGCISALIQKDLLELKGNGASTLRELIEQHPFAQQALKKLQKQCGEKLNHILGQGESFFLSHIGNIANGATFLDLKHLIDDKLLTLFDSISHRSRFYYGRYDIKCTSVEEMKEGKNFMILEFNGAGSVPNHVFTGNYTLREAYKEILRHWRVLFEISIMNHRKGIVFWSLQKGYTFLQHSKKHFHALKQMDKKLLLE